MALCSYQKAKSLVELSDSPVFHFQFSSIYKPIHHIAQDAEEYEQEIKTVLNSLF